MSLLKRWLGDEEGEARVPVISRKGEPEETQPAAAERTSQPVGGDEALSFLAEGLHLEGTLRGRGTIRVNAFFRGEVHLEGTFIVGPQGRTELTVCEAQTVVVEGLLKGPVRAGRVVLKASGRLFGDVVTQALEAEAGGFLQGRVQTEERVRFSWQNENEEAPSEPPSPA